MDKTLDGKRKAEYFREYYRKNKERIAKRAKAKYQRDRSDPEKILKMRAIATKWTREYRKRHPERVKALRRKMHIDRKVRAFIKIAGEVRCRNCGCDDIDLLEVNHKNGGGCKEWRETGRGVIERVVYKNRKTDDLEILCRVCNALDYLIRKKPEVKNSFEVKWTRNYLGQDRSSVN